MRKMFVWTPLMFCLLLVTGAQAQQGGKAKSDNSGTNPINFTNDFRIWNETQDLNGDNTFSKLTFEYRFPLGKTWAAKRPTYSNSCCAPMRRRGTCNASWKSAVRPEKASYG